MFQSGPDLRRIDKCLSGLNIVQFGPDLRRTDESRSSLGTVHSGSDPRWTDDYWPGWKPQALLFTFLSKVKLEKK